MNPYLRYMSTTTQEQRYESYAADVEKHKADRPDEWFGTRPIELSFAKFVAYENMIVASIEYDEFCDSDLGDDATDEEYTAWRNTCNKMYENVRRLTMEYNNAE